jgi:Flp pilus assembly protein TadG
LGTLGMVRNLAKFLRRNASRFRAARVGATAVEFALIAPVFIGLLIAIFETTLFLFAQASLQSAAMQAGRLFMTGQAQNSNMTVSQFKSAVCPMIQSLFNCNSLIVVVQNYASFSGATTSAPQLYNAQGQAYAQSNFAYSAGQPGDVMIVQLVYPWSVVGGPLGFTMANLPNNAAEMMGVTAFRVEPY